MLKLVVGDGGSVLHRILPSYYRPNEYFNANLEKYIGGGIKFTDYPQLKIFLHKHKLEYKENDFFIVQQAFLIPVSFLGGIIYSSKIMVELNQKFYVFGGSDYRFLSFYTKQTCQFHIDRL